MALAAWLCLGGSGLADDQSTLAIETPVNDGDDITRPLDRFDVRLGYLSTADQRDRTTWKLRGDRPVNLAPAWKITFRLDLPLVDSNAYGGTNPSGAYRVGLGDILTQVLLTHDIDARQAFGIGTQLIFPTASDLQLGTGKLQMLPTAGYRYALPDISEGSFITLAMRYDVDVAGSASRRHISNLQIAPTFNLVLPSGYFLSAWPSTSIRYSLLSHSWFVPLDLQVGRLWGKSIVTTLEAFVPLYRGTTPLYNYRLEARVGFFF